MENNSNENTTQNQVQSEENKINTNYISSKISVDFFVQQVKIYITIPQHVIDKLLLSENDDYEKQIQLIHNISLSKNKHLIINKKFKVVENSVIIDDFVYQIPDFFNKECIKNEDTKVWEMIFYQIFSDEVSKNILKFKELYKQNKHNKTCEEYANEAIRNEEENTENNCDQI